MIALLTCLCCCAADFGFVVYSPSLLAAAALCIAAEDVFGRQWCSVVSVAKLFQKVASLDTVSRPRSLARLLPRDVTCLCGLHGVSSSCMYMYVTSLDVFVVSRHRVPRP